LVAKEGIKYGVNVQFILADTGGTKATLSGGRWSAKAQQWISRVSFRQNGHVSLIGHKRKWQIQRPQARP
jgi:hypothetical protein